MAVTKRIFFINFLIAGCFLLFTSSVFSAIIRVPQNYPAIRYAVDAAVDGDTVLVDDGLYTGLANDSLGIIHQSIVLKSLNGPANTVIECSVSGRLFDAVILDTLPLKIEGFTLKNFVTEEGPWGSFGGAIFVRTGPVEISNCIFENSSAEYGGAVLGREDARLKITECIFYNNSAEHSGGAVYCIGDDLTIENSVFSGNSALFGGAIYVNLGKFEDAPNEVHITSSTFVDNHADSLGSAAKLVYSESFHISNSIFAFNTGSPPLSVETANAPLFIECTDVYGNEAGDWVGTVLGPFPNNYDNFSISPEFCSTGFHILGTSPCAPWNSPCGELVGAKGVLCDCCQNLRGDFNLDGLDANILDLTYLVDFIFRGGAVPVCDEESDINADGNSVNILDLTYLVDFIFRGGEAPSVCPS